MTARTANDEQSPRDEAFRSLRSTVKFAPGELPVRTVLVVDVDRDETSDIARRLADAFARAGDRCAYVETDGRLTLGEPGFSDLIRGAALDRVVTAGGPSAAAVIPAGAGATPDLLSSDDVTAALISLLERFEFVVLSCAPLPQFADALALAPRVDAVIMVVGSGKTRRPRAVDARDALRRVGARILGVVLAEQKRGLFG